MNKSSVSVSPSPQVCHYVNRINSNGIPYGDDPLGFSLPCFLLQFSLISIVTRSVHFILKPLGQPLIVAQILGGTILGPSLLGQNLSFLAKVFPRKSRLMLDTVSIFGFTLFAFLIGVKMDLSQVVKSGKRAMAVGILGFFVPFMLSGLVALLLDRFLSLDHDITRVLPHLVAMLSMTAFPVVTSFLDEQNILNSEMGRLASSSSIICDVCLWSVTCIKFTAHIAKTSSTKVMVGYFLSSSLFIASAVFVIRPMALWVIRNTPEPKPIKEIYVFIATVIMMVTGFFGEVIGIHATTATLILGLIIPDGPPLAAALVDTLESFVSLILMPIFFAVSGLKMDVFCIHNLKNFGVLQLIVAAAFIGKIVGSMLPLIVCRVPFRDALSLGLIMNTKGIVELAFLNDYKNRDEMTEEVYSIMIISIVAITGVISPIVKLLYDPSKRFIAYKRRTIMHSRPNDELHVLACIHRLENVASMMSLLQISNATKSSPVDLVVLHLIKLTGRATSLLVPHTRFDQKPPHGNAPAQSDRIFNAFKRLEHQHPGFFQVHCYKGISPYMTMHNDVCSLALEKRTILIVLPFHKLWSSDETVESSYTYRRLNRSVLDKAPCSVGILIDRRKRRNPKSPNGEREDPRFLVAVLFFGGADDREALSYAQRMSDHTTVGLTLIRFATSGPSEIVAGTERSKTLDADVLSKFKIETRQNNDVTYEEKVVSNEMDVIGVIGSIANSCNLVMVGRRHGDSEIMNRLKKWNERGELGSIGEILAGPEFRGGALVLVVQQQTKLWGLKDPEESTHLRRIKL